MTVERIISDKGGDLITADPSTRLIDISRILADKKIGAILITTDGKIDGILSERDVVRAIATDGALALERQAEAFMTREVVTCGRQDTINQVMEMMTAGRFRHVPVVEDGKVVGIVSIGDVVKRRIAEIEREAESIRDYITMS